jgi:CelD/BcsL family acetyltransferase involved in cellulose biosynthesis
VAGRPRVRLWPTLPLDVYARRRTRRPPFPLGEPNCRLYARGRHALWHGVRAAGLEPGSEVLAPAYNCGAEVQALLEAGLAPRFFDVGPSLEPDEAELESLLGAPTRAMLLIHYLGFPQDAARWKRWCDDKNLLLIEDCAPAWMASIGGRPVGSFGELAIFSLYKVLPLLPVAALLMREAPPEPPAPGPAGSAVLAKRHLKRLMTRSAALNAMLGRLERRGQGDEFALGDPWTGPTRAASMLLGRLARPAVAERRRANYRLLLEETGGRVPPAFARLPDGASPLVFPLDTEDDPGIAARLAQAGIEAAPIWPRPHPLVATGFPGAAAWRRRFIGVPVHQELRDSELEQVAAAVRSSGRHHAPAVPVAHGGRAQQLLRLEPVKDLEQLAGEWPALAERTGNLFATWEWQSLWWRHFGGSRPLLARACRREDGSLAGILPLYLGSRRPLPVVRFLGSGSGDRLGPICASGDRPRIAQALRAALSDDLGGALLLGEQLPADEGWSGLLGAAVLTEEASPVLRFETGGWDEFMAAQRPSQRKKICYEERRLEREHGLRFRLVERAGELPAALDALFTLHHARGGQKGSTAFAGAEPFHRAFAGQALERGWLRLWLLELEGRPAAAWYGFRFAGVDWHYQSGRDPSWDRFSVGSVMQVHTIRDCLESGLREYRFLRGGESYKQRLANFDPGLETLALPAGPAGHAAIAAARAARRMPAGIRARLRRMA